MVAHTSAHHTDLVRWDNTTVASMCCSLRPESFLILKNIDFLLLIGETATNLLLVYVATKSARYGRYDGSRDRWTNRGG